MPFKKTGTNLRPKRTILKKPALTGQKVSKLPAVMND